MQIASKIYMGSTNYSELGIRRCAGRNDLDNINLTKECDLFSVLKSSLRIYFARCLKIYINISSQCIPAIETKRLHKYISKWALFSFSNFEKIWKKSRCNESKIAL